MLKGDLASTPLPDVLTQLAESAAVGCLHVESPDGDEALVYFKAGQVYSTHLPGRRPQLGARLISSGALAPEALEEALEAQATELQGWRLGELLVHLGFVEKDVVEAFGLEQVRDACFEISRWNAGKWKFRKNEKTREDVALSSSVQELLDEVLRREQEWAILIEVIGRIDAVPLLGAGGVANAEMALDQDQWALLCKVDGERNVHQLARDCGYTDFEAGQIVSSLALTGLLEIESEADDSDDADDSDREPDDTAADRSVADMLSEALGDAFADRDDDDAADDRPAIPSRAATAARLAAALSGGGGAADAALDVDDDELHAPSYTSSLYLPLVAADEWTADSAEENLESELSRLMSSQSPNGDSAQHDDAVELSSETDDAVELVTEPDDAVELSTETDDAVELSTETDEAVDESAGELANVAADEAPDEATSEPVAEGGYTAYSLPELDPDFAGGADPDADLPRYSVGFDRPDSFDTSLAQVSEALSALLGSQTVGAVEGSYVNSLISTELPNDEEQRERRIRDAAAAELATAHQEMEEQRRRFDDARRRAEEQTRLEAEEAVRVAAEAEAARLAAEEEAARLAAEAEAARIAAEEEAARLAAQEEERLAAERAQFEAEEAARLAAEEEAARLAAEEEAARIAAEEAAQLAADEAARLAAEEEAARLAAEEEAARVAADEEAARIAAEDESRLAEERARFEAEEAVRLAAEEEAALVAAEDEARLAEERGRLEAEETARRSAEAEAARVAGEAEAARVAGEAEAARVAGEAEAARVAAEDEAARAAAQQEVARIAAEQEAARVAAEQVAAAQNDDVAALLQGILDSEPPPEPEPEPEPEQPPAPPEAPAPAAAPVMTDTASLMRELSSLGLDDDAPATHNRPTAPVGGPSRSPAAQPDKGKKRKGLFGRG